MCAHQLTGKEFLQPVHNLKKNTFFFPFGYKPKIILHKKNNKIKPVPSEFKII